MQGIAGDHEDAAWAAAGRGVTEPGLVDRETGAADAQQRQRHPTAHRGGTQAGSQQGKADCPWRPEAGGPQRRPGIAVQQAARVGGDDDESRRKPDAAGNRCNDGRNSYESWPRVVGRARRRAQPPQQARAPKEKGAGAEVHGARHDEQTVQGHQRFPTARR